jgi:hypothetical protein
MTKLTMTSVSVATFLSAMGCGGAGPSSTSPSETSPVVGTIPPPAATVVSITGFVHASDGTLLPGATVCLQEGLTKNAASCTTSGSAGTFTLAGAPANGPVILTFQKDGFVPGLRAVDTEAVDLSLPANENTLMPSVDPQTFLGMPADPSKGQITFSVTTPAGQKATDASVRLTRFEDSYSQPPVYLDSDGAVAVGATTGSRGGFVNLAAGLYALRFAAASVTCTASTGLYGYPVTAFQDPSSGEATVLVPVFEGYVTAPVGVSCASAR